VFLVALGALILFGFQLGGNHTLAENAQSASTNSTRAARQAKTASREALAATAAIQQQRITAIRLVCENQNRRHDATLKALDRVLHAALRQTRLPAQRAVIRASRAPTVLIINALAPKQNCSHVTAAVT
jgi:undecaprenyl pyrophosphate synthase